MARYRKIDARIWNDAKFRSLSDCAKLLFLYLLTHPNGTALGAFRGTPEGFGAELVWTPESLSKAFQEVKTKGLVEHDPEAHFVALPNFLKYNKPESPNVIKSWVGCLDLLPECQLKLLLMQRLATTVEALGEGFRKAFAEAFPKSMPYQEQEQEQEQKDTVTTPQAAPDSAEPKDHVRTSKTIPKKKTSQVDLASLRLPESLDTSEFREALQEWMSYRREIKKPLTAKSVSALLKQLESLGSAAASCKITAAIANGWQGVVFNSGPEISPRNPNPQAATAPGQTSTVRPFDDIKNEHRQRTGGQRT